MINEVKEDLVKRINSNKSNADRRFNELIADHLIRDGLIGDE